MIGGTYSFILVSYFPETIFLMALILLYLYLIFLRLFF